MLIATIDINWIALVHEENNKEIALTDSQDISNLSKILKETIEKLISCKHNSYYYSYDTIVQSTQRNEKVEVVIYETEFKKLMQNSKDSSTYALLSRVPELWTIIVLDNDSSNFYLKQNFSSHWKYYIDWRIDGKLNKFKGII